MIGLMLSFTQLTFFRRQNRWQRPGTVSLMTDAVEIDRLTKISERQRAPALEIARLRAGAGEMVGLIGASGSGKSTVLRHIDDLTLADRGSGSVRVAGRVVQSGGHAGPGLRQTRAGIGMVFRQFNLVARLSAETNLVLGVLSCLPVWSTSGPPPYPADSSNVALQAGAIVSDGPPGDVTSAQLSSIYGAPLPVVPMAEYA